MTELVQHVARALCARACDPGLTRDGGHPCDACDADKEPTYLADARAVISAIDTAPGWSLTRVLNPRPAEFTIDAD